MSQYVWIQKQNIGPTARMRHTMAYDRKRKQVLLFGGLTWFKPGPGAAAFQPIALTDTWAWDGAYWTQVSDMGPSYGVENFRIPKRSVSMTYDIQHELIILYFEGGTWAWDGKYWGQVADTGPVRSVEEHEIAMAYLPQTSQVYAHGNMGMGTWRWDGNEWLQVADNGPDKGLQALVCDEQAQRLLLFEGETGVTWEFNGDTWQAVTSIGPGKGVDAQITYDGNRVVALVNQNLGDHFERRGTWSWEAGRWKQVENMGPGPRIDIALAGNIDTARTVLFGGSGHVVDGAGMLGDTWEFGVYPPGP